MSLFKKFFFIILLSYSTVIKETQAADPENFYDFLIEVSNIEIQHWQNQNIATAHKGSTDKSGSNLRQLLYSAILTGKSDSYLKEFADKFKNQREETLGNWAKDPQHNPKFITTGLSSNCAGPKQRYALLKALFRTHTSTIDYLSYGDKQNPENDFTEQNPISNLETRNLRAINQYLKGLNIIRHHVAQTTIRRIIEPKKPWNELNPYEREDLIHGMMAQIDGVIFKMKQTLDGEVQRFLSAPVEGVHKKEYLGNNYDKATNGYDVIREQIMDELLAISKNSDWGRKSTSVDRRVKIDNFEDINATQFIADHPFISKESVVDKLRIIQNKAVALRDNGTLPNDDKNLNYMKISLDKVKDTNLSGYSFIGSNCENVNFENYQLLGSDFRGAELKNAKFPEDPKAYFAANFDYASNHLDSLPKKSTSLDQFKYEEKNNNIIIKLGKFDSLQDVYLNFASNPSATQKILKQAAKLIDKHAFLAVRMEIKSVNNEYILTLDKKDNQRDKINMLYYYDPENDGFKEYFQFPFKKNVLQHSPLMSSRAISFISNSGTPLVIPRIGYLSFYDFAKYARIDEIKGLFYHAALLLLLQKKTTSYIGASNNGSGSSQSIAHFHLRAEK